NARGTAPGLICPIMVDGRAKVLYALPGVPHEMYEMFTQTVLADLHDRSGSDDVIVSRVLRTWGESESGLNERLDAVIAELDDIANPTLAFLASGWEGLKIRLTAKAGTEEEALELLDRWTRRVTAVVGEFVFGFNDDT
ncbi:MAG TPA: hypothetical protein PLV68_04880, partial [Ilumatobacteraceae bacterium]|nr:hypothetical protein [Ilumatobacteraceae bacterium]